MHDMDAGKENFSQLKHMTHRFVIYNWETGTIENLHHEEERKYRIVGDEVSFWIVIVFQAIDIPNIHGEEKTME